MNIVSNTHRFTPNIINFALIQSFNLIEREVLQKKLEKLLIKMLFEHASFFFRSDRSSYCNNVLLEYI